MVPGIAPGGRGEGPGARGPSGPGVSLAKLRPMCDTSAYSGAMGLPIVPAAPASVGAGSTG